MVAAAAAAGKRATKTVERLVEAPRPVIKKKPKAKKAPPPKKEKPAKKSAKKEKKEKTPRAPSAYNIFMKEEIAKVKKANPSLDHKEAFKKAASNWKSAKK